MSGLENEEKLESGNDEIKKVNKFKYLGSILELSGKSYCEIKKRINEGIKVIRMLNSVFGAKIFQIKQKFIFKSFVQIGMLYMQRTGH